MIYHVWIVVLLWDLDFFSPCLRPPFFFSTPETYYFGVFDVFSGVGGNGIDGGGPGLGGRHNLFEKWHIPCTVGTLKYGCAAPAMP